MNECKTGLCSYKKLVGGLLGAFAGAAILFFSCGKADEAKKDGTDANGDKGDVEIHLTFDAYADKTVEQFRVYAGTSKDTLKEATNYGSNDFNYDAPEITIESKDNAVLTPLLGGQGCFQLRAVKEDVESDGSNVVCTDL